jgi:hypothetical protein
MTRRRGRTQLPPLPLLPRTLSQAYRVPQLTFTAFFTPSFWAAHGMMVAECISYGLIVHAALHLVKDAAMFDLLRVPRAVRYQQQPALAPAQQQQGRVSPQPQQQPQQPQPPQQQQQRGPRARWSQAPAGASEVVVQPPVFADAAWGAHNAATFVFWLACLYVLLDGHIAAAPINRAIRSSSAFAPPGDSSPGQLVMPAWALTSLLYLGMWLLHALLQLAADRLPAKGWGAVLARLARKDNRRAAEDFFPFGASRCCAGHVPGAWGCVCSRARLTAAVVLAHAPAVQVPCATARTWAACWSTPCWCCWCSWSRCVHAARPPCCAVCSPQTQPPRHTTSCARQPPPVRPPCTPAPAPPPPRPLSTPTRRQVLFDFFLVLRPLATGPVRQLVQWAELNNDWAAWTSCAIVVGAMWVTAAFLVWFDTGLFFQLVSALYSTLVLGLAQRLGHVK